MKIKYLLLLFLAISEAPFAASYDLVFTIQMGAFQTHSARETFIRRYHELPLYCRKNSRDAFMVYYGIFQSDGSARPHLGEIPDQPKLGAYVVKLKSVQLVPCSNMQDLLEQIY
jgi:hypothetical protein